MSNHETSSLITQAMLDSIGVVYSTAVSYPVATSDIRKWALAVYYPELPPRLYWDEDYASNTPWGGIVAPHEFNPFGAAWIARHPEPLPLPQWGKADKAPRKAGDFEVAVGGTPPPYTAVLQSRVIAHYGDARIRPGDVVTGESYISEYFEREGRMGHQLYTTVSVKLSNQVGEWIKTLDTVFVRY